MRKLPEVAGPYFFGVHAGWDTQMMINFSRMRFLVVDDFSEFRSSIRGVLGLLAVQQIDMAANGEEVLELCRRNRYDVILHDYNLGKGASGQQILERLHAERLLSPHCIFIMVTAENTQAMVLAALECEPDDYLSKPFSKVALQTRLERMVRRKRVLAPVLTAVEAGDNEQVIQACQAIEAEDQRHAVLCQRYKADALFLLGRYTELEKMLEQQVRSRPANWNVQRLARLWLQQGRYQQLTPLLDAAMRQFPLMPELYDIQAQMYANENDLKSMVRALQQAVALSPNTLRRQISLAQHAWLAGEKDIAAHAIRQCWENGRYSIAFDVELLWQLSSILLTNNRGRAAEELQNWLKLLERRDMQTPLLLPAIRLLRLILEEQKRGDSIQAQEVADRICMQLDGYTAVTLLQLGDWLQQLGQAAAAARCWQACADRHEAVTGVPEQLEMRLGGYSAGVAIRRTQKMREAVALQLNEQPEQAAGLLHQLLQEQPKQIALNMAAIQLYIGHAAGDTAAMTSLKECLQRIGRLSPLEPDALEFSRLNNPLEKRAW